MLATLLLVVAAFCLWRVLHLSHRVENLEIAVRYVNTETQGIGDLPGQVEDLEDRLSTLELSADDLLADEDDECTPS